MKDIPYRFLMADGTPMRLQGPGGQNLGKADMRWALASLGPDHPFELVGFWIGADLATIRQDLGKCLDYDHLQILFSDGGSEILENLLQEGMKHQRCQHEIMGQTLKIYPVRKKPRHLWQGLKLRQNILTGFT